MSEHKSEPETSVPLEDEVFLRRKENGRKYPTLPSANKKVNLLRPASFASFLSGSSTSTRRLKSRASSSAEHHEDISTDGHSDENTNRSSRSFGKGTTVVTIVLVEAKGLPGPPEDGSSHGIYCKFTLGNETFKSKIVPNTRQPTWKQRFKLQIQKSSQLKISLWDKGKQKNFMGGGTLELSTLEMERTHEIWQSLDDGFGSVHISLTICTVGKMASTPTETVRNVEETSDKYTWYHLRNLQTDWNSVGQVHVKLHGAKGLNGKPNAYCILELDNERVQTHCAGSSSEPTWNKDYLFNVHDVTSTLDIRVYDNSIVNIIQDGFLGKISIPLLRVNNSEKRWFALKDKSKRNSAKGNCPRVLVEMTMVWNPVKATARMFRPREVKYIKKPKKFDVALVYNNVEFIRDTFHFLLKINEGYKRLFEWENHEFSCVVLICWLAFWFFFELWMMPLLLLTPFFYFGLLYGNSDEASENGLIVEENNQQNDKTITKRMKNLPEMTLTITDGIEYIATAADKFYNLVSFKVPFVTHATMVLLVGASVVLYLVPFNYLLMAFGLYKFGRKYLNPDRELNNDIVDFISHLPDNDILKDWKELAVPEPSQPKPSQNNMNPVNILAIEAPLSRSHSTRN